MPTTTESSNPARAVSKRRGSTSKSDGTNRNATCDNRRATESDNEGRQGWAKKRNKVRPLLLLLLLLLLLALLHSSHPYALEDADLLQVLPPQVQLLDRLDRALLPRRLSLSALLARRARPAHPHLAPQEPHLRARPARARKAGERDAAERARRPDGPVGAGAVVEREVGGRVRVELRKVLEG